jgi:predicted RNA methylase
MDIEKILTEYTQMDNESKKQAVRDLFAGGPDKLLQFCTGELARPALRVIADGGKNAAELAEQNSSLFTGLLKSEDPKIRMLAAEILGSAGGFSKELITACHAEQTMFALPSFLLAIGAQKTEAARRYLENYTVRSDGEKHIREEKQALQKALANFVERKTAQIRILKNDILALSCPNTAVTLAEAKQKGFRCKKSGEFTLVSGLEKFNDIYALRTFDTAYLLLGTCGLSALSEKLSGLQEAVLSRMNVTNYRLEVANIPHKERVSIISECVSALDRLVNTPSAYSFEIRLEITGDKAVILLDPHTDKRFSYRKKAVSASISPAVAASVCYAASSHFNPEARVLDNFCGSGTMLFERSFYPHASLTGVDIAKSAVDFAQENEQALKSGAKFYHADALRFTSKKFDEIICNMPFGLRVGTHAHNVKLYESYIAVLPSIVEKGGHAFLYTHEKQLLEDILKRRHINVLSKTTFAAGGLFPALYILGF